MVNAMDRDINTDIDMGVNGHGLRLGPKHIS
jgi:hypothetical protein